METKICIFNNYVITFALSKDNGMMINATEMAKAFGKEVKHFNENGSTENFINACLISRNSDLLGIKNREDLIISRKNSGTFMHRILALKFAAWLDPVFEIWVYATIEKLLFGKYAERDSSFKRTLSLKSELDKLRDKPQKTGEDFERYLEIERNLRLEKSVRKSLIKDSINEMADLFDEDDNE